MGEETVECLFYSAEEVRVMLGLGKTKAYEYLEQVRLTGKPFVVIRLDKLYKIPKASFDQWISKVQHLKRQH